MANLTGKPTTKSGFGITDVPAYSDLLGLRNRLINGNFAIKQDATYASGASDLLAATSTTDGRPAAVAAR